MTEEPRRISDVEPRITDAWLERAETQMASGDLSGMFVNRDDVLAVIRECRRLRLIAALSSQPAPDAGLRAAAEAAMGFLQYTSWDNAKDEELAWTVLDKLRVALSSPETTPAPDAGEVAARAFIESVTVFRDVDAELVNATLAELSESPLPGARYAYEVVRRRFASALATPAGVLDEAWEAAEKALPAENGVSLGWEIDAVNRDGDRGWEAVASWRYVDPVIGSGPTPAAALRALAAALGRSGSGGGRG